ncbi:CLUMA_CG015075, isoform A [Clunio marinus]|uniref:CLUMA_CG015075, isoform A n=1 Tax=Clunio marinus TaxID=568069 RepID=A0A1J1IPG5_9DIPT|nr:CLUMA_CG015075, isoform A [Clunio marinus]
MFTNRGRQSKRKYMFGICAVIFVYLLLFSRYQTYEIQEVIKNVKPVTVWEFVADFSKMKSLNPTIHEFKILSDHGNNEDWKYTVEYIESMSGWPHWKNKINANFHVRKVIRDRKYLYLVESVHKSCFFSVFCLKANGEFEFTDINNGDTLVTETVKYQCPPFLGQYCRKEVEYQRKKILYNLTNHFKHHKQEK